MDAKEFFKKQYGISVPHSWCAYNGTNMVEFAEKYHQHRLDEKPQPISDERIDELWGEYMTEDPDCAQFMEYDNFKTAIKELKQ